MAQPQATSAPAKGTLPPNAFDAEDTPAPEDEGTAGAVAADEGDAAPQQEDAPAPSAPDPEAERIESEARLAGWVSREEWVDNHGSPKGWKSAADYVDFRRNFLPLVSKENKELRGKVAALEAKLAEREKKEVEVEQTLARERLNLELEDAVEAGDRTKVRELTNKLFDLKLAQQPKAAVPAAPIVDPEVRRDFDEFSARNGWLKTDTKLAKIFAIQLKGIMETGAADSIPEALEDAKDMVRRMYPEKFVRKPSMAESGGEHGVAKNGARSWNDLTQEYRDAYNESYFRMNPEIKREALLKELPPAAFRR